MLSLIFLFYVSFVANALLTRTDEHLSCHQGCRKLPFSGCYVYSSFCLFGKGFRGIKNKQAELAKKLELAKQQQKSDDDSDEKVVQNTDSKQQQRGDENLLETKKKEQSDEHAEFARLLAKNQPMRSKENPFSEPTSASQNSKPKTSGSSSRVKATQLLKSKSQQKETTKTSKGKTSKMDNENTSWEGDTEETLHNLQQGDKARRLDFETLHDASTSKPLGAMRAAQLVPWVPPFLTEYLIVLADPRPRSPDLRQSAQYLHSEESFRNTMKMIAITADDSTKETLAWMKRVNITPDSFGVLLDNPTLDWMMTYGCIEDYSLHILVIDSDGIIQKNVGNVKPSEACHLVSDIVTSLRKQ